MLKEPVVLRAGPLPPGPEERARQAAERRRQMLRTELVLVPGFWLKPFDPELYPTVEERQILYRHDSDYLRLFQCFEELGFSPAFSEQATRPPEPLSGGAFPRLPAEFWRHYYVKPDEGLFLEAELWRTNAAYPWHVNRLGLQFAWQRTDFTLRPPEVDPAEVGGKRPESHAEHYCWYQPGRWDEPWEMRYVNRRALIFSPTYPGDKTSPRSWRLPRDLALLRRDGEFLVPWPAPLWLLLHAEDAADGNPYHLPREEMVARSLARLRRLPRAAQAALRVGDDTTDSVPVPLPEGHPTFAGYLAFGYDPSDPAAGPPRLATEMGASALIDRDPEAPV